MVQSVSLKGAISSESDIKISWLTTYTLIVYVLFAFKLEHVARLSWRRSINR